MSMLQATFAVLRQILLDLGFTMRGDAKFIRFDHAPSGTWFLYPPYGDDEQVNAGDLVAARRILDERGLMPRERFEQLLGQKLLAG
jgi:hypothetical protein